MWTEELARNAQSEEDLDLWAELSQQESDLRRIMPRHRSWWWLAALVWLVVLGVAVTIYAIY